MPNHSIRSRNAPAATHRRFLVLVLTVLIGLGPLGVLAQEATSELPRQPMQPVDGPGGSATIYDGVREVRLGESPRDVAVFVPEDVPVAALHEPEIVILIHGFMSIDPEMYRDWIHHLVRRGSIVIFPVFQSLDVVGVPPPTWPSNLLAGLHAAFTWISGETGEDVRGPVHVIGHSLGGPLAIRYAVEAESRGFPAPATLFVVQPGGCQPCGNFNDLGVELSLESRLPSNLMAQMLVGDRDTTVGDADARDLWPLFADIPAANRDYVTIRSDDRGEPPVVADHTAVGTGNRPDGIDVIDWFALWRAHDALMTCASSGTDCDYALGDTPEHRFMGTWSDGVPIVPLLITEGPPR